MFAPPGTTPNTPGINWECNSSSPDCERWCHVWEVASNTYRSCSIDLRGKNLKLLYWLKVGNTCIRDISQWWRSLPLPIYGSSVKRFSAMCRWVAVLLLFSSSVCLQCSNIASSLHQKGTPLFFYYSFAFHLRLRRFLSVSACTHQKQTFQSHSKWKSALTWRTHSSTFRYMYMCIMLQHASSDNVLQSKTRGVQKRGVHFWHRL